MRDKLHALLRIKPGEELMVSMLLTQSVFLGVFIGAFDISAHSLLLSTYDEKIMARGYIVSGITGIILAYIFIWLKAQIQFKRFLTINLFVATILTLILWLALIFFPAKWIVFLVFIMFAPLNIMTLLGFWEMVEKLLSREQARRLLPVTDTGLISGTILISLIIPILLSLKFQVSDILFVSTLSVFMAAIIQIMSGNRFALKGVTGVQDQEKNLKNPFHFMIFHEDQYIRVIGFFSALSVITAIFIQYSFMALTRELYPVAENMAGFLCLFTGSTMIMILFLKLVVFDFFLHTYGLKACLIATPLLIAVFTLMAMTIGSVMGHTPDIPGGFIIFFILIASARLISGALRESVQSPSLKIINQSLKKSIGTELLSGTQVINNYLLLLFAGLILTLLGLVSSVKIIHFTFLLLFIASLWLYVAFRLYKEYRLSVHRAAGKVDKVDPVVAIKTGQADFKNKFAANLAFKKDYFGLISGNYQATNGLTNRWYYDKIINHAVYKKDINLIPVLKKASVNKDIDEVVRQHSEEAVRIIQENSSSSGSGEERMREAMRTLSGERKPQTTEILRLLRDSSVESKRLAILMIGKFGLSDLSSEVCGFLTNQALAVDASEVLKTLGKEAESSLIRLYLSTSGNTGLSRTILQLLGKRCNSDIAGFLFERLWSNSRQLKEIAAGYLLNCNFTPSMEESIRLNQLISEIIGIITWCLSAEISLQRENDVFLLEKIKREFTRWNKFLFNILSITYNSNTVSIIKENIEIGTTESVSYALEMADTMVSDIVRPQLIYLLDEVPDEVKLRNLYQFYALDIPDRKKILEDILNRDYNLLSLWTRACTLRTMTGIEDDDIAESVTALLFSPEEIIREESAYLIARSAPELYNSASERLPGSIKDHLNRIIDGTTDKREMLFEKVEFLSSLFDGILEDELLSLASGMKFMKISDIDPVSLPEGFIIWTFPENKDDIQVHIFYDFSGNIPEISNPVFGNNPCYCLPLAAVEQYNFHYPDNSLLVLKYVDDNES